MVVSAICQLPHRDDIPACHCLFGNDDLFLPGFTIPEGGWPGIGALISVHWRRQVSRQDLMGIIKPSKNSFANSQVV